MTVRCPRCDTLFRRPLGRAGSSTYRCARCHLVFDARGDGPVADDAPETPPPDDDVFTFDEPEVDDEPLPEPPPPPVARRERRGRAPTEEAAAEEPPAARYTVARFALRSLIAVSLAYGVLSIYLLTHGETARGALGRVPLVGGTLKQTRLSPGSIQLINVRGEYRRVKGDHLVFVITGTAVNNAPVAVKSVQIEGRIVGSREERQIVFCGAAPGDVHDLSLREIALLQTLEPSAEWSLAPAGPVDFLIVFPQPPPELRELTVEVVGVRAEGRRRPGPPRRGAAAPPAAGLSRAWPSPGSRRLRA